MRPRVSIVNDIRINAIALSSIFLVGDAYLLEPRAKVFAIQREIPIFWREDTNIDRYSIYTRPIKRPLITEKIKMVVINESPVIKVNSIRILGISTSAILQIGSNKIIDAEARVKHIRYLAGEERPF